MTDKLPPNLLALFAPRPPLRWVPPPDHAPEKRKTLPVSGVAEFLPALQAYKETDEYKPTESWLQMRDRKKLEKQAAVEKLKTEGPKNCQYSTYCFCRRNMLMLLLYSQTPRGLQHSRRCFQDFDCCATLLRGQRAGSREGVWPFRPH